MKKAVFPCGVSIDITDDQANKIRFIQSCIKQTNPRKANSARGCFDFILEPGRREKARKERLERQAIRELGQLAVRAKAAHPDMDALEICQDIERQVADNGLKEGGVWSK